jgi:hypothetical protein
LSRSQDGLLGGLLAAAFGNYPFAQDDSDLFDGEDAFQLIWRRPVAWE